MRAAAPSRPPVAPQGIASPLHRLFALACFAVCHRSIMFQLRRVQLLCRDWYARLAASRVNFLLATSASGWPHVAVRVRAHPRRSLYIRTNSRTSARIRRHPRRSARIRRHPRTSAHLRRHPQTSVPVRGRPQTSAHIRAPPQTSATVPAHPRTSASLRAHPQALLRFALNATLPVR